jgi:chromosome segregation ATPase
MQTSGVVMTAKLALSFAIVVVASEKTRISPELSPVSDGKFFGRDYPHDAKPQAGNLGFKYPFPKVQDSNTFDEDFVKDENSDGGEWAAQAKYDKLRKKLRREEADVLPARHEFEEEEKQLAEAQEEMAATRKEHDAAEETERVARKDMTEAMEEQNEAEKNEHEAVTKTENASAPVDTPGLDDVEKAKKLVEDRIKHVDDCKAQLAKAQEALKAAVTHHAAMGKEEAAKLQERLAKAAAQHDEAKRSLSEAEAALESNEASLDKFEKAKHLVDETVTKEEAQVKKAELEHDQAEKNYEKEIADVKKTETELKEAEEDLRNLRHGVTPKPKSGSSSVFHSAFVTIGVMATAIFAN